MRRVTSLRRRAQANAAAASYWLRRRRAPRPTRWFKKSIHKLMAIILSNLNRFTFFTERFLGKFAVKWLLKIPRHLAYVATLLFETLMSENKRLTINYKIVKLHI